MIVVKPGGQNAALGANILISFSQHSPQWVHRLQERGSAGVTAPEAFLFLRWCCSHCSHCTLHSRTFNSPSAYAISLSHAAAPRTHAHGAESQTTALLLTNYFPGINNIIIVFFLQVMTCSHISVFPAQHQTSRMSVGRPAGCFCVVVNWGRSESVDISHRSG